MSKITFGIFSLGILGLGFGAGYLMCKHQLEAKYQRDLEEVKEQFHGLKRQNDPDVDDSEQMPDSEFYIYEPKEEISEEERKESLEHLNTLVNQTLYAAQDKGKPIISYNKVKPELKNMAERIKKQLEEDGIYDENLGREDDEEDSEENEGDIEESSEDDEALDIEAQKMYEAGEWAEQHKDKPYLIDYDDFEANEPDYEQQALFFYNEDAVLCDEDDKIIEEYEDLIGYDWERVFFKQTNAWVRNDKLKTLYEIHSIPQAYSEAVAGFIGTDREREFNRRARMKQIMDQ